VIATGLGVGTLFTLFVVPAVYMVLSSEHRERLQTAHGQFGRTTNRDDLDDRAE